MCKRLRSKFYLNPPSVLQMTQTTRQNRCCRKLTWKHFRTCIQQNFQCEFYVLKVHLYMVHPTYISSSSCIVTTQIFVERVVRLTDQSHCAQPMRSADERSIQIVTQHLEEKKYPRPLTYPILLSSFAIRTQLDHHSPHKPRKKNNNRRSLLHVFTGNAQNENYEINIQYLYLNADFVTDPAVRCTHTGYCPVPFKVRGFMYLQFI